MHGDIFLLCHLTIFLGIVILGKLTLTQKHSFRKRIIAGTRPIIIKKVTIRKEKKIFFKKSMYFH